MQAALDVVPWATAVAVLLAIVGGVVVIVGNAGYTFPEYQDDMKTLIGLLAVGRGVAAFGNKTVIAK